MDNLFLVGPSRAGKSMLARKIVEVNGAELVDIGQIARLTAPAEDKVAIDAGGLSARGDKGIEWVNDIVARALNPVRPSVIVGFPRTMDQLRFLLKHCAENKLLTYRIICVLASSKVLRMRSRDGRSDMGDKVLDAKHQAFYQLLNEMWPYVNQFVSTEFYPTPEGYAALARMIICPNYKPSDGMSPMTEDLNVPDSR